MNTSKTKIGRYNVEWYTPSKIESRGSRIVCVRPNLVHSIFSGDKRYGVPATIDTRQTLQMFGINHINSNSIENLQDISSIMMAPHYYVVYFTALKLYKIGYTVYWAGRKSSLRSQFGNYEIVNMIYSNSSDAEKWLHWKYRNYNVIHKRHKEFFDLSPEAVASIERIHSVAFLYYTRQEIQAKQSALLEAHKNGVKLPIVPLDSWYQFKQKSSSARDSTPNSHRP